MKKIYIEISDSCGLRCGFCPISKDQRGKMPLNLFEKIVFEIAKDKKNQKAKICLHLLGDPCKREDWLDFVEILEQFRLKLDLVTSGYYTIHRRIFDFKCLNQIAFSLDAGLDANNPRNKNYLKKILDFCTLRLESGGKSFINLRIQDTSLLKNRDFIQEILDFFKKEDRGLIRVKLAEYIFLVVTQHFEWAEFGRVKNGMRFCHGVKNQIGILANGKVVPCCIDGGGQIVLGDLNSQSLKEILESERAVGIREGFQMGIAVESLCQNCDFPIKTSRS